MFKKVAASALCATLGCFLTSQGFVAGHDLNSGGNMRVASVPGPDIPNPWEVASVPGPDIPNPWEVA